MFFKISLIIFCVFCLKLITTKDVYYFFNVNYICSSPDGVEKCSTLAVNEQFPGPPIKATIGDTLHVTVFNNVSDIMTTIHWHGFFQNGTPFEDGPDMVTQCPIPFRHKQIYRIELKQAGTYWWHSHVQYQYTDGMWGSLVIHDIPEVYANDYDYEFVITLTDWYHISGRINTAIFLSPASHGAPPAPDSVLLNGHGIFPCNATTLPCDPSKQITPIFNVIRGKRYRFRLINTSAITTFLFSIEDHILSTIEVDGVTTVKVPFTSVPIAPAQRYSFIVDMNGDNNEYLISAQVTTQTTLFDGNTKFISPQPRPLVPIAQGILRYRKCSDHHIRKECIDCNNTSIIKKYNLAELQLEGEHHNQYRFPGEMLLRPYDGSLAPYPVDQEIKLNILTVIDPEGVTHLTFNGIIYTVAHEPVMASVLHNRPIPLKTNPFFTGYQKVIQVIINNPSGHPHPIHLHGHNFFVMGAGIQNSSDYDPSRDELVLNGVRRDTVVVLALSWVVFRFVSDNPGVWFIHCHINWHLQSGFAAVIIEAPHEARRKLKIPLEARRICESIGVGI